ncbi:ATP phosphoribosyltransferase regulatory subunit [Aequoribacter fuscus]|uniref:ATP phosphoribosyltransferase regulatory subunit n=1 Tax=Aequoribacter fuscus TaxID=2518989 RepID=F3L1U9_9GAMM|nr:ATP phosphoribosyltransferase regulatory subunit [Aequoribacter fuscus]EGG29711.1 ATP phosphoribosyltransferase regulatory subunit [Aequoribacter fuscus]QHJ88981.1 ATP phosphoribosyltransferase regulatory subunit [Aequoribacter fuscus]
MKYWQLPQAVEEVLPEQASALEALRRELLDLYKHWGYELVFPPLIEYSESLLTGLGADLDLLTFKLTDQLTGRTLGIRADITPQVARIDAHSYLKRGVSRLCYAGTTLHTRPKSLMASRCPIQVGAELYGDSSEQADIEIIRLLIETLRTSGVGALTLDIGHVGVYQAVFAAADIDQDDTDIFDALQRKSAPDLAVALQDKPAQTREWLTALMNMHGDIDTLDRARQTFGSSVPAVSQAIDQIETVIKALSAVAHDIDWYVDLAELRGLNYHTGLVFAAYAKGAGQALANGGRYDSVGQIYGRARAATGFAVDLKTLLAQGRYKANSQGAISVPAIMDTKLESLINDLRASGQIVIRALLNEHDERCDREIVLIDDVWTVRPIGKTNV